MTMTDDTPQKLEIDWFRTTGGALAAVSSAVLLSTLGAAGTIIGAALGSVVATVGGALYSQGLGRSREHLVQVQATALRKAGIPQRRGRRGSRHGVEATEVLEVGTSEPADLGWRERFAMLPWKRIWQVAAGV